MAFLLDMHLRKLSDDRCSLVDVMRQLWKHFRIDGYTLADFEAIASDLAGADLAAWFDQHIRRSDQLDYREAFEWLGLQRESAPQGPATQALGLTEPDGQAATSDAEWELGCETLVRDGRIVVTKILRNSSASVAGLQVDDELIAISGYRLPKENWKDRLQCYPADQELVVTVARRGRIREIRLRLQKKLSKKLQSLPTPSPAQSQRRLSWLFG